MFPGRINGFHDVCLCRYTHSILAMSDIKIVREWDADSFHRKVLELEQLGYVSKMDTYQITAEMNPETGLIVHLHTIEMHKGG